MSPNPFMSPTAGPNMNVGPRLPKKSPAEQLAEKIGRLVLEWDGLEPVRTKDGTSKLIFDGAVVSKMIQDLLDAVGNSEFRRGLRAAIEVISKRGGPSVKSSMRALERRIRKMERDSP